MAWNQHKMILHVEFNVFIGIELLKIVNLGFYSGLVPVLFWAYPGFFLGLSRFYSGLILVVFWAYPGFNLGLSRFHSGRIRSDSGLISSVRQGQPPQHTTTRLGRR